MHKSRRPRPDPRDPHHANTTAGNNGETKNFVDTLRRADGTALNMPLSARAAIRGVSKGVCGYRGFIPRHLVCCA
eukprot:SAG11_NODE_756_length_7324_cov_13.486505_5_plen_75_part_00